MNKANIQKIPEILEDRYMYVRSSHNFVNINEVQRPKSKKLLLIDKDEIVAPKTELDQKLKGILENTEHRRKDILKDWRKKKKRPEEDTRRKDIMKDSGKKEKTRRGHRKEGHHERLEKKKEKTGKVHRRKVPKEKNHKSIPIMKTLNFKHFIDIKIQF
ncbi:unnamed protein product [Mytilus coruscus]|uniref:Uncharacterized protein n=1 Tax=Mytilus coruscus TaxID=42192 RepID=A0A6J8CPL6_MYTCO|nr:unnamed protein product [Mytilus coruscus]